MADFPDKDFFRFLSRIDNGEYSAVESVPIVKLKFIQKDNDEEPSKFLDYPINLN